MVFMNTNPQRVAFLGPRGTFTEQALQEMQDAGYVSADAHRLPADTPREAMDMVRAGRADFACLALESSVDGPVSQTEDALAYGQPLQIYREHIVPIVFSILVRPGTRLEDVRTFTTHPVAEAQTREWRQRFLPNAEFTPASSNGAAAQAVAEGKADAAAAPARAGEIHGLAALARSVADVEGAATRFVLVGRPGLPTPRTGNDRTGVIFRLHNRPSSLVDALAELSVRGVDMSRISSRPIRQEDGAVMGMYMFHVGVVGHIDDAAVGEALAGLRRNTESLRYLGSWPSATDRFPGEGPADYTDSWQWVENLRRGEG